MKVLIVEDQELYADQLERMIDKLNLVHHGTVDNSDAALTIIEEELPDLILMDIHIVGKHDGIELADMIQKIKIIPIIFITSLKDDLTISRALRLNSVHFLLKPFDHLQLQRTIQIVIGQLESSTSDEWENDIFFEDHFFIKTRQKLEKVKVSDVMYVESDGHYCQVHTKDKKFLVRMSMSELGKRLPEDQFIQTHRSFIVRLDKVDSVDLQDSVLVLGGKHVPMSKRNKDGVLKRLNWI